MTIRAFANAQRYDWATWLLGIMRSFLSGGAAALAALGGSSVAGISAKQTAIMTGSGFLIMGLYRMGEFLELHGAPDQLQATLDAAAVATKEAVKQVSKAQEIAPEAPKS
jgi:putative Ca2+/H+ antiporter (TMEM165/GDT1 family)